jgi:hypothetical protein
MVSFSLVTNYFQLQVLIILITVTQPGHPDQRRRQHQQQRDGNSDGAITTHEELVQETATAAYNEAKNSPRDVDNASWAVSKFCFFFSHILLLLTKYIFQVLI